jgi:hypothetical protein
VITATITQFASGSSQSFGFDEDDNTYRSDGSFHCGGSFSRSLFCVNGKVIHLNRAESSCYAKQHRQTFIIFPADVVNVNAGDRNGEDIDKRVFLQFERVEIAAFDANSCVTILGKTAFCRSRIRSIHIPCSVKTLGPRCFEQCVYLAALSFEPGSQLEDVGYGAFWSCSSLQSVSLPSGVLSLGKQCFKRCVNLVTLSFEPGSKLNFLGDDCFAKCCSLSSMQIPDQVRIVGARCFRTCRNLVTLCFPVNSQLVSFDTSALTNCSHLQSVRVSGDDVQHLLTNALRAAGIQGVVFSPSAILKDCVEG